MGWGGTGRDGTGRDGTGRDGTGRDGTGRDGTGRDGTGRDGTGRDGTSLTVLCTVTQGWDGQLGPCSRGREEKHHPETNGNQQMNVFLSHCLHKSLTSISTVVLSQMILIIWMSLQSG